MKILKFIAILARCSFSKEGKQLTVNNLKSSLGLHGPETGCPRPRLSSGGRKRRWNALGRAVFLNAGSAKILSKLGSNGPL